MAELELWVISLTSPKPPCIPGKDVAGVIDQVQEGSKFKPGDKVVASKGMEAKGGMSEYFAIQESLVAHRPDSVDALVGAACADSAVTANFAVELARVTKRSNIFYLGPKVKQFKFLLQRISRSKIILIFTAP